jgi:hypothetical protein
VTGYFARIVRRNYPVSSSTARAAVWLLVVAFVMVFLNVIGLTLGSSVFLAGAGASQLPIAYVAMGVLSLPFYWGLSRVADRYSRASLVGVACAVGVAMSLGLAALLPLKSAFVLYVAFMFFYFNGRFISRFCFRASSWITSRLLITSASLSRSPSPRLSAGSPVVRRPEPSDDSLIRPRSSSRAACLTSSWPRS